MPTENETQSIAPESQGEPTSNEAASVLTQSSLFQPAQFDVRSYANDLLECDSTTTMQNTVANRSFAIIESAPSRNLVSYSFSSEEEERTAAPDKVSEPSNNRYHFEHLMHDIVSNRILQPLNTESEPNDVCNDNEVVDIPSKDNILEKVEQQCISNESGPESSQYQFEGNTTSTEEMEVVPVAGVGSDGNPEGKEITIDVNDTNNNAKLVKQSIEKKEKVQRSKQTLLDRWLQITHGAHDRDEERHFKCMSCHHEFFTQGGLDMHFRNAHSRRLDISSSDKSEEQVTTVQRYDPAMNPIEEKTSVDEGAVKNTANLEMDYKSIPIDDDINAILAKMLTTVEEHLKNVHKITIEKVQDETEHGTSKSPILIAEIPDVREKSFSGDNTVIPYSVDENLTTTNITSDESYIDVENTSAKDMTDTDIFTSIHETRMKSVTLNKDTQDKNVADPSQYKVTTLPEIHKDAISPKFQPSVVLTDCGDLCSDISMDSIDAPQSQSISGELNEITF